MPSAVPKNGATVPPSLRHRGGLASRVPALHPDPALFEEIGGESTVAKIVDGLYDRIEADPVLRPLFRRNLSLERQHQKRFFAFFLGGENRWGRVRGMVDHHRAHALTPQRASHWLKHFTASLEEADVAEPQRQRILATLRPIAKSLINPREELPREVRLACGHTYEQPVRAAAKGDLDSISTLMDAKPEFAEPGGLGIQILLFHAARRGRLEVVEWLLDRGADPNLPDMSDGWFPISPVCIARARKQTAVADRLVERGAIVDVFTASYLGDVARLGELLDEDANLANATDPALDYVDVTPLRHAIEGNQPAAAQLLLERGADPAKDDENLLATAAEAKSALPLVELLLAHGAEPAGVEPGPWVLDQAVATALFQAGVDFRRASAEWVEFCTGHHGNRENPDLIRAFVEHGVDVDARADKRRTGLHCSTRVGYTEVMRVLLEGGADVHARDRVGDTPLAYVFQARKNVDLEATAKVLLEFGAKPGLANDAGQTPLDLARKARKPDARALVALFESSES